MRRGKDYDYTGLQIMLQVQRKICTRCRIEKHFDDFSSCKSHPTGKKSECRECASTRFKKWKNKNPELFKLKDRVRSYIKKYGMSEEKAWELVNDRNGDCAICNKYLPLVVDHNHDTGIMRGMICSACNSVLGYSRENIDTLYNAITYLKKYEDGNAVSNVGS